MTNPILISDNLFSMLTASEKQLFTPILNEFNRSETCRASMASISSSGVKFRFSENGMPPDVPGSVSQTSFFNPSNNSIYIYGLKSNTATKHNIVGVLDHEIFHAKNRVDLSITPQLSYSEFTSLYYADEAGGYAQSVQCGIERGASPIELMSRTRMPVDDTVNVYNFLNP